MLKTHPMRGVARFESFEVDVRAREVRKHGHRIRLQDQPFRVLLILLEQPGEVVTREDLQRQIWPSDTFVDFDRGLNNAVKRLREALNDSAETPRYIETLPKLGYRFIAPVNAPHVERPEVESPVVTVSWAVGPATRRTFWKIVSAAAAGLALLAGGILGLNVGKIRDRLFVTRIPAMTKEEGASFKSLKPGNPKALEDFLEGRYHLAEHFEAAIRKSGTREKSEEEFAKGMSYLEQSIQEDPSYVPAYLVLAEAVLGHGGRQPHAALEERALKALNKALSLDETNLTAHLLMAEFLFPGRGYDDPESHYKRVIQLDPNFAEGHEAYAEYLDDLGRFEEGMKEHQRAQTLDPDTDYVSSSPLTPLAVRLERNRKFMATSSPVGIDYWRRGDMEFEAGQYAEAIKDWEGVARDYGWNEEADAWVHAFAKGGPQALIREVAKAFDERAKDRWFPRDMIINAHRYADDREGALAWLETAEKEWDLSVLRHLRSDYRWDPYRSDPRFQAIIRRVQNKQHEEYDTRLHANLLSHKSYSC